MNFATFSWHSVASVAVDDHLPFAVPSGQLKPSARLCSLASISSPVRFGVPPDSPQRYSGLVSSRFGKILCKVNMAISDSRSMAWKSSSDLVTRPGI